MTRQFDTIPLDHQTHQNGTNAMHLLHEELARAQMSARLGEAQTIRRERQLAHAVRLSRKAEATAQQARLALARLDPPARGSPSIHDPGARHPHGCRAGSGAFHRPRPGWRG